MNERILELFNQASKREPDDQKLFIFETFIERFSELLIREYSYDILDVTNMPEKVNFVAKKWGVEL